MMTSEMSLSNGKYFPLTLNTFPSKNHPANGWGWWFCCSNYEEEKTGRLKRCQLLQDCRQLDEISRQKLMDREERRERKRQTGNCEKERKRVLIRKKINSMGRRERKRRKWERSVREFLKRKLNVSPLIPTQPSSTTGEANNEWDSLWWRRKRGRDKEMNSNTNENAEINFNKNLGKSADHRLLMQMSKNHLPEGS